MVFIIGGSSHTGKTFLAQKLLEKYKYPYFSIDHLKMGLIRSKKININVEDDEKLTEYLWPIVSEIIKTAIENKQNLIVEGCYVPYNFKTSFSKEYLENIKEIFLVFSEQYVEENYHNIMRYENVIEKRLSFDYSKELIIKENNSIFEQCKKYGLNYILINEDYILTINENLNNL